jgi:hypothetical protein
MVAFEPAAFGGGGLPGDSAIGASGGERLVFFDESAAESVAVCDRKECVQAKRRETLWVENTYAIVVGFAHVIHCKESSRAERQADPKDVPVGALVAEGFGDQTP